MQAIFIFTNFNNTNFTQMAIESIENSDAKNSSIIIVDNDSNQENRKSLKDIDSKHNNVIVIYNNTNVGYFEGLNVGIRYMLANNLHADCYVIGNNDLLFPENFMKEISDKATLLSQYPVISPNIVTVDGVHQNPHVISGISKFREFVYDIYHSNYTIAKSILHISRITKSFTDRSDELQHETPQEIAQGYGACYILSPIFFKNFQELWSPTFLMYEEFFLSKQLAGKNYKCFYEPSIHIQHFCHASTGQLPGKKRWEFSKAAHKEYRKHVKVLS